MVLQFPHTISPEMNLWIAWRLLEEVKYVLFSMKRNAAPGLDGLPVEFYVILWNLVKQDDVLILFEKIFDRRQSINLHNSTFITLVPKVQSPTDIGH